MKAIVIVMVLLSNVALAGSPVCKRVRVTQAWDTYKETVVHCIKNGEIETAILTEKNGVSTLFWGNGEKEVVAGGI
jgi:hypothetical protein